MGRTHVLTPGLHFLSAGQAHFKHSPADFRLWTSDESIPVKSTESLRDFLNSLRSFL
jgi:hypothetical protein